MLPTSPRLLSTLLLSLASLVLSGCQETDPNAQYHLSEPQAMMEASPQMSGGAALKMAVAPASMEAADQAAGNTVQFIEESRYLRFQLASSQLESRWQADANRCQPPSCDVLQASFNNSPDGGYQSAYLSVRVARSELDAFVTALGSQGLLESRIDRNDRSAEVIDADARLTNLEEVRNRLRALLNSTDAKLGEVIQLERELGRVQSELDAAKGRRAYLANLTEKVRLDISYEPQPQVANASILKPLWDALYNAGAVFFRSLAQLLTLVISALPWLLLAVPLLALWHWWRKR
ncbi:DUF4349 domain-containing protein [Balneatrix alpica]|uniref:DUF4349 domain-containing protein n=1 Tax=Balneatrix alpica TaxID=75684 RepID=A0ABV5Z891_9GAMM|nr:DUF4349 domain-containing protein [Balneatrix alpica]